MSFHAEPASDGKVQPSDLQAAGFSITQRLGQALDDAAAEWNKVLAKYQQ